MASATADRIRTYCRERGVSLRAMSAAAFDNPTQLGMVFGGMSDRPERPPVVLVLDSSTREIHGGGAYLPGDPVLAFVASPDAAVVVARVERAANAARKQNRQGRRK